MNLFELSAKISVDDSNFKKSMENAQKVSKNVATAIKQLQSPLDKAKSGFNAIAHPVETAKANIEKLKNATEAIRHPIETFKNKVADASTALETKRNKLSALAAGYDSAKKKVADITKEFNKSAKESGTSSQKTQELAKKLNEAEKEAEEAKKELDDYSESVSKAGKNSDSASKGVGNFASKLGKGLATAGKVAGAALGVAAAGITALTTAAVNNYAEYEQLVGGAELMFGKAYDTVAKNAQYAYKTVQMSQNEYLQQVNGFATGLKTALGGNEQAAAELAHNIVQAEADIIAATGNTAENVQNAFNGIMKSNFTMLDNLQIGITPTKEGFQEVIDKVNEWNKANGEATNYQMGNLADMQSALVDYIDMVGMSGYAQREASKTISGSIASMKSAWSNLLTGLADDNADFGTLIDNLVYTLVGDDSGGGVINNMLPRIEKSIGGIAQLIESAAPVLVDALPALVNQVVPSLISAATGMVNAVVAVLPDLLDTVVSEIIDNAPALIVAAVALVEQLSTSVLSMLPDILQLGIDLIFVLLDGITKMIDDPAFIQTIVDVVLKMVDILTNPDTITKLLNAAATIIVALAKGLIQALPQLLAKVPEIIGNLAKALGDFASPIFDAAKTWGKDLMDNFVSGIKAKIQKLKDMVSNVAQTVKDFLGFSEPEKGPLSNFHTYAPDMMDLFAKGIRDNEDVITDQIEKSFDFGERTMKFGAEYGGGYGVSKVAGGSFGGTSFGDVYINIDGANYSDPQSLAVAVAQELQNMTDRRLAVYA